MYKLAVFDLDGTLLDTLDDITTASNYALHKNGYPIHSKQAVATFVGNGIHAMIVRAMPPHQDAVRIRQVEASFRAYYIEHAAECTRPYPGIVQALRRIAAAGIPIAVLSNKGQAIVTQLVERFFADTVALALGQREAVPLKPDPAALRAIMNFFRVEPEACVYVGDSHVDMQTGRAAGVFTVGVEWGYCTKDKLETQGASITVNKIEDLVQLVIDNRG